MEPGEDDAAALVREMREETGLDVAPGPLVGTVQRGRYAIADYRVHRRRRHAPARATTPWTPGSSTGPRCGSLSLVPELLVSAARTGRRSRRVTATPGG